MGNAAIFSGKRTKLLSAGGILTSVGRSIDYDGNVNFIENSNAVVDATGWGTYKNAVASSRPSGAITGTASVTWTRTTTSSLSGDGSFLFTKGSSNLQGEGAYYAFSVPLAYRAKTLTVSMDYILNSGTFTAGTSSSDSDVIVYFYDVTNSTTVAASKVVLASNSTSVSSNFTATVVFPSTCTDARIFLHVATTSASAYTLKIDNVLVGPTTSETVAMTAQGCSATVTNTLSNVTWTSVQEDTVAGMATVNYTAKSPGLYAIDAAVRINATSATTTNTAIIAIVKGTSTELARGSECHQSGGAFMAHPNVSKIVRLAFGDTVKIQVLSDATSPVISGTDSYHNFNVRKIGE